MNLITLIELVTMKENKKIKKELKCGFIRIKPDGDDYDEYIELGRVKNYIDKSKKKLTEESLIERVSKILYE